jgi:D-lactate dehydrogenase (cytochrome)
MECTSYSPITAELRERINRALGADCEVVDPQTLANYDHDASELRYTPEMVVVVRSRDQVQELLRLANQYRFPVTPRSGGTGLAGGCLPVCGGVVLDVSRMNRILAIDTRNLIAEVQPGVITHDLREAARAAGLFYPPDPASLAESTLGGNAATNAGGPACVKYGTTKDYVLGLEAVLPNGQLIRTGVKTRKGVVGYDMTHLIIGSEGTLGVITALTLKLIPHPPAITGMVAVFSDLETAMGAVAQIMTRGHLPSAIEFLDHKCLALVGDRLPFEVPGRTASLLIIETDGIAGTIADEIDDIGRICRDVGAVHLQPAAAADERERIWDARRQVSLRIHDHAALYVSEDVAVPLGCIAELVACLPDFEQKYRLEIYAFGHAGDGNIHLNITAADRKHPERVEEGIRALLRLVLEMGGTISGEHGIGAAKKRYLPMELSAESIRLQQGIKALFDPNRVLNPGKLFADI